jgi:hypothetical protein
VWFAQAEAQFALAGISNERLKFYHFISHLDHRYATEVEDIITSPPTSEPYMVLKDELVRRLSPTPEQRICRLLTAEDIGDCRPSQFLRYLRSLAPDVSENVLRSIWTSRLPQNIHCFLAGLNETNLDAAALCADQNWTEALPLVLLGNRTSFKEDLQASVAELVYSEPVRISGKLLTPNADPVDPALLITELRPHMARLRPIPASRHTFPATFVHSDLDTCTHVFLRQNALRRALEPPYSGQYWILSRRDKMLGLLVCGKPVTVSTDRVKPAYILNGTSGGTDYTPTLAAAPRHAATSPASQPSPSHSTAFHTATTPLKNHAFRMTRAFSCSL